MRLFAKLRELLPALKSIDTIHKLTKCDVLLICQDVDRGDLKFGLPYSKLLDSVHEDLTNRGYLCKQFAPPFSIYIGKKAWAEPYSANRIFLMIHLLRKLFEVLNLLINKKTLPLDNAEQSIYRKVLMRTNPQFVVAIGASSSLCMEARALKIPVMELLHGIGYDTVKWGWENLEFKNLPTHILSLDPISTKSFSKLNDKGIEIFEIPHPWYSRFEKDADKSNIDPTWVEKPKYIPRDKKVVLVSITWGYDGDHGPYGYFANILTNGLLHNELLKAIRETKDSVFWCLRRHPVQVRSSKYDYQIKFLNAIVSENPNVEWEESTRITLNSILPSCDGHLTMFSMTAYDAASMGIKSLLLCPTLKEGRENSKFFSDLEQLGYVVKTEPNVNYIIEWVTDICKSNPFSLSEATTSNWKKILAKFKPSLKEFICDK